MRINKCHCFSTILITLCGAFAACAMPQPAADDGVNRLYVPSAALVQGRESSINAANVLACGDEELFFARGDKALEGALPIAEISAFTIYTYDAQRISDQNGSYGYRYRSVVQQGVSAPPVP